MNDWNPEKYLQFKNERTQPAIDLVSRININNPERIIDIGCGPGNSTQILVNKWPESIVTGLDSSESMIKKAKTDYPKQNWINAKAENIKDDKKFNIVFSNAALQWMGNHELLIPNLWKIVDKDGALAVQIPRFEAMPINEALNTISKNNKWNKCFEHKKKDIMSYYNLDFYYDILTQFTETIELWETHYFHILPTQKGIVDFIHTTALKPYLECLDENKMDEFENDILEECKKYYKIQKNGRVLFPFKRIFFIAYKNNT
jgi:trans-aconitate 2-methyltransferase